MSDGKTEKKGILQFKEDVGHFMGFDKGVGEFTDLSRTVVAMHLDDKEIGYIDRDGSVTFCGDAIRDEPTKIMSWGVTLTPAQRKEIDRKADEFQRKCDVDNVVTECEATIANASKFFPMFSQTPTKDPVKFTYAGDTVQIRKGEYHIGVMWLNGVERGKLVLTYEVQHTGLSEANKLAIVEKCRATMMASW